MFIRWLKTTLLGLVALYAYRALQTSNRLPLLLIRGSAADYDVPPDDTRRPPLSHFLAAAAAWREGASVPNATGAATAAALLQSLLDFGIVGHPKTGTTFLLEWLARTPGVLVYEEELYALQQGNLSEFVERLYRLPPGFNYRRGYKAPRDVGNPRVLDLYRRHFPATRLVVGLRHPVRWFESFYNYRTRHNVSLPPADAPVLVGACTEVAHGVCTDESQFHYHLALLGKVNLTEAARELFPTQHWDRLGRYLAGRAGMRNPVFLYDVSQLSDANNATRAALFRRDLARFLRLERPLAPYVREKSNRTKLRVLDICRPAYAALRAELLRNARGAAAWISGYFLDAEGVHVSSREHFEALLEGWNADPCLEGGAPADAVAPNRTRR